MQTDATALQNAAAPWRNIADLLYALAQTERPGLGEHGCAATNRGLSRVEPCRRSIPEGPVDRLSSASYALSRIHTESTAAKGRPMPRVARISTTSHGRTGTSITPMSCWNEAAPGIRQRWSGWAITRGAHTFRGARRHIGRLRTRLPAMEASLTIVPRISSSCRSRPRGFASKRLPCHAYREATAEDDERRGAVSRGLGGICEMRPGR
jgi:hypothetical protein